MQKKLQPQKWTIAVADQLNTPFGYDQAAQERFYPEKHRSVRPDFARDRARVLHSAALRRLAAKTQVLSPASGADFARNRLTHSLEVAQVGREIAAALRLDPDVVDTACLTHDIGHPPFGHNGERALNSWSQEIGGFEGNAQTLRVLSFLEPKVFNDQGISVGLNLTRASLDASCKYPWLADPALSKDGQPQKFGVYPEDIAVFNWMRQGAPGRRKSIEAQTMDLSDDIAYSVHDFEDAVVNGYLDVAVLVDPAEHKQLITAIQSWVGLEFSADELSDALYRLTSQAQWLGSFDGSRQALAQLKNLSSDLIGRFARAATQATRAAYPQELLTRYQAQVVVPRVVEVEMAVLKGIIGAFVVSRQGRKRIYRNQRELLTGLATTLSERPELLQQVFIDDFEAASTDAARKRVIVDQIASMSDQQAISWYQDHVGEIDPVDLGIWFPHSLGAAGN